MSVDSIERVNLILSLLEQTTTLDVVCAFLKERQLKHSASSWEILRDRRILPALGQGLLAEQELINLLRDAEETGRQHVFLFRAKKEKAVELLGRSRMMHVLRKKGITGLLEKPMVLDQPTDPTIADVRWITANADIAFVAKVIEMRTSYKFIGESVDNNVINKRYEAIRERAVNVIKLHRDGLLEVRIGSHRNSSQYKNDVFRVWHQLSDLFPESHFGPVSLANAKDRLWNDRKKLSSLIRYSDTTLRNDNGNVIRAATGSEESDLYSDEGVTSSIDEFLKFDAYCDGSNFWFKAQARIPSRDIHVLLSGELNEFAVPANCTPRDYEYVLSQLRALNT